MYKPLLTVVFLMCKYFTSFGQEKVQSRPQIQLGVIPKLLQINMLDGIAPAGDLHQKNTLAVNFSANLLITIKQNFTVMVGAEYNVDRYKSHIMFDHQVDRIGYYGIWEVRSSEYFTQNVGLLYHFKGKFNKFSTAFLVKYKLGNSLAWQNITENQFTDAYGNPLNIYRSTTTLPSGKAKLGYQLHVMYNLTAFKNIQSSIGLVYQMSAPYSQVTEVYKINQQDYQYRYDRKSAFWGVSLHVNYGKRS